jgi:hypothetical protein
MSSEKRPEDGTWIIAGYAMIQQRILGANWPGRLARLAWRSLLRRKDASS